MIRLLVADDHEMFRDMLKLALVRTGDTEVVGEAGNGRDLCNAIYRSRPDVVLLDYRMPYVRDFAALLREIRATSPRVWVIVLSGFANADIAQQAAEGGARGYILKATRLTAVADAVRAVAAGGIWIDPNLPRKVFDVFQSYANGPVTGPGTANSLTRREREILSCLAEGASNLDIAMKLGISEQTVKTHLSRVFAKLSVKNRVGAAMAFLGRSEPVPRSQSVAS
jgi:DNA-binding NarL/FixJ family response regulator